MGKQETVREIVEATLKERLEGTMPALGRIVTESGRAFFLKTGPAGRAYRCEACGLKELAGAGAIVVPAVAAAGDDYILTEYVAPCEPPAGFFGDFGRRLARLHRAQSERFGFCENNFIGNNPQPNIPDPEEAVDWRAFYFGKRLLFQFRLAERNGYASPSLRSLFRRIEARLDAILDGSDEPPCLLHGDLWAGNFLCRADGQPVLVDPAVYYGHREADLAMTRLFGGFAPAFYAAYQAEYPLREGWEYRENIYRLYHVLNHLNLFGRGYLAEAEALMAFYAG